MKNAPMLHIIVLSVLDEEKHFRCCLIPKVKKSMRNNYISSQMYMWCVRSSHHSVLIWPSVGSALMSSFCFKNRTLTVPKKASICINILVNHIVPCHLKEGVWHPGSQSKVCEYVQEIRSMFIITTRHHNLLAGLFCLFAYCFWCCQDRFQVKFI